ncbi:MAG: hypothetical protein QY332_15030 [Anaerolineales bacterium]|nr:MAG: hypothetical protein QY332_15030 [Anaerolineales bacterium]
MEILGIGINELIFIIIIALLLLGPKDMQKAGMTLGKWLRGIITSDGWKVFQQTSRELRTLPNKLMREANEELNQIGSGLKDTANLPRHDFDTVGKGRTANPPVQDGSPQRVNTPTLPPRSQPSPGDSAAAGSKNKNTSSGTEENESESSRQKDA